MNLNNQLVIVLAMLGVILVGFAAFIFLVPEKKPDAPKAYNPADMVTPTSYATGAKDAKVVLVEWGDFECPFCASVAPVLERIAAEYTNNPDFSLVFRHFPLPQHKNARVAAEAAEAAGAQGKFWEMYDLLYQHQGAWSKESNPRALFGTYADQLGLDRAAFDTALEQHTYAPIIEADYKQATMLGLDHTPTLILNGADIENMSYEALKAQIDLVLSTSGSTTTPAVQ